MNVGGHVRVASRWIALLAICAFGGVACSAEETDDADSAAGAASVTPEDWTGIYAGGTPTTDEAFSIVGSSAFGHVTFSVSAKHKLGDGRVLTADVFNLIGQLDVTREKVKFDKDGCHIDLTKNAIGIRVAHGGTCTKFNIPEGLALVSLGLTKVKAEEQCWDVSTHSRKMKGECTPHLEGLYAYQEDGYRLALNIRSREPFVFSIRASKGPAGQAVAVQNASSDEGFGTGTLVAGYTDAAKTSALFAGADCRLRITQNNGGPVDDHHPAFPLGLTQSGGNCASVGVPAGMRLEAPLKRESTFVWEPEVVETSLQNAGF